MSVMKRLVHVDAPEPIAELEESWQRMSAAWRRDSRNAMQLREEKSKKNDADQRFDRTE